MTFNAATFIDTTHMSSAQAKRLEQRDDIDHLPRVDFKPAPTPAQAETRRYIDGLRAAAKRFEVRRDNFAIGKAATCNDIADKLLHFGCFASDNQMAFAYKLIGWSAGYGQPHPFDGGADKAQQATQEPAQAPAAAPVAPTPAPAPVVRLPALFELMQRLSKLTIGSLTIARKNQDSLCWVKVKGFDSVVGKIENGVLSTFHARLGQAGTSAAAVIAELLRIEADPEAAAALHGKLSGRCSICSRDLTDPVSIERGIGPICIGKAGW